jgi:hypothetical protein
MYKKYDIQVVSARNPDFGEFFFQNGLVLSHKPSFAIAGITCWRISGIENSRGPMIFTTMGRGHEGFSSQKCMRFRSLRHLRDERPIL